MITWEYSTRKKLFMVDHIINILCKWRITDDTYEFYAESMKRYWDCNPENRSTSEEIYVNIIWILTMKQPKKTIELAEGK
jgi:hypothetical protein